MPEQPHICAEIQYTGSEGNVHSDICGDIKDQEWGDFLHKALEEWLEKSNGTGFFHVGSES